MDQTMCSFSGCTNPVSVSYVYAPPYDISDILFCDYHKCSQPLCGNQQDTNDLCVKHNRNPNICNIRSCSLNKENNYDFCCGHICIANDCCNARTGAFFCILHKCIEKECNRVRDVDNGIIYCYGHCKSFNKYESIESKYIIKGVQLA